MTQVAIVYHSGYGHTKLQAEAVAAGAASVDGVEVRLLTTEEAIADLASLEAADAIVFGAPTYMGSASAGMKAFIEASSKPWAAGKWRDKIAGGFTNSHSLSGDKSNTLMGFAVLAAQHKMIWVGVGDGNGSDDAGQAGHPEAINRTGSWLGLVAQSENDAPSDANPPKGDIETAKNYGQRLARAAVRWRAGAA